ncbi:hypothetical protein MRX96_041500 [Rhipicephalus microplus]
MASPGRVMLLERTITRGGGRAEKPVRQGGTKEVCQAPSPSAGLPRRGQRAGLGGAGVPKLRNPEKACQQPFSLLPPAPKVLGTECRDAMKTDLSGA